MFVCPSQAEWRGGSVLSTSPNKQGAILEHDQSWQGLISLQSFIGCILRFSSDCEQHTPGSIQMRDVGCHGWEEQLPEE